MKFAIYKSELHLNIVNNIKDFLKEIVLINTILYIHRNLI